MLPKQNSILFGFTYITNNCGIFLCSADRASQCIYHQEVKIALHCIALYHHTYRCDDTRGCVMQFWPPDVEHMCSKHVEAWNEVIVKQKFFASSWLITEINCGMFSSLKNGLLLLYSVISNRKQNGLRNYFFRKLVNLLKDKFFVLF